jgi:FkbH-like protein
MRLRQSRFLHLLPLDGGRVLAIHALSQLKLTLDEEAGRLIEFFAQERELPGDFPAIQEAAGGHDADAVLGALQGLVERGVLTSDPPEAELAQIASTFGRDPHEMLDRFRLKAKEGGETYWATGRARGLGELGGVGRRVDVVLMGDCDIQMESEFLQAEAGRRGIDLRVAATFPDDLSLLAERQHDAVMIGALRSRHLIMEAAGDQPPFAPFVAEARHLLTGVRGRTTAPILIDNLPEPTVEPLGMAERGQNGHRNRFRLANVALADVAAGFDGAQVVDVAAVLAQAGSAALVDDGQVGFTHFGSPGWMLQRPEVEKSAVHGIFPDVAPLAALVDGDPYRREKLMAAAHLDALTTVLAIDQKKCVILDLDGTIWPGVLAETGAPFAWAPDVSGPFSYIGLYFGLHEALLALKQRGVLLACVSKNDQSVVERLWAYPDHYPRQRLLTPADFVTWRVNWSDKSENIRSIAQELGFALETFLFVDDHPVERDRVRQKLPQVEVWGEDLFDLRRRLLTDPRLQRATITAEAASRTELVKAQLARQQAVAAAVDESGYLATLNIQRRFDRLPPGDPLMDRVQELFQRTTQFNTTGRKFTRAELDGFAGVAEQSGEGVFSLHVSDRFGDHGLVGAAVIADGEMGAEILGLAMSCRVLGMGVEHAFMGALQAGRAGLAGRIIDTDRNLPVRNIFRDNGFEIGEDGLWRWIAKA